MAKRFDDMLKNTVLAALIIACAFLWLWNRMPRKRSKECQNWVK